MGSGAARDQQVAAAAQGAAAGRPALRLLGDAALHAAVITRDPGAAGLLDQTLHAGMMLT